MKGIGGNLTAEIQVQTTTKNRIGEYEKSWATVQRLRGWLDRMDGTSNYRTYSAKMQDSTHVFVADYKPLDKRITAETARMIIKGKRYDIMLIDNPMEMETGSQLEIYLKYTGGQ